jgi:hypothetical protein
MPNAVYPKINQAFLEALLASADVKVALIDTAGYTYSSAHEFLSSVPGAAIKGTSANLSSKTFTNGAFDSDTIPFTAVPLSTSCEALIFYIDTGNAATSRLVAYFDSGVTGLPVTPNGGDINVLTPSGIITLGSTAAP